PSGRRSMTWSAFDGADTASAPILKAGDAVFVDVPSSSVISSDPKFTRTSVSGGVMLTALEAVPIPSGNVLLTVTDSGTPALFFSVTEADANGFYEEVFAGRQIDGTWSTRKDLADMIGRQAAVGGVLPPAPPVPAMGSTGALGLAALLATCGAVALGLL